MILARYLIAIALVVWLIKSDRLDFSFLSSIPLSFNLIFCLLFLLLNLILQSIRWKWLLRINKIYLSTWESLQITWIGQFFSLIMPGASGGEIIRGYYISKKAPNLKLAALSTLLIDRFMSLYGLMFLSMLSFILILIRFEYNRNLFLIGLFVIIVTISSSLFLIFMLYKPLSSKLYRLLRKILSDSLIKLIQLNSQNVKSVFKSLMLSFFCGIILICAFYLAGEIVGEEMQWHFTFLIAPVVILANNLPIAPGGIGVAETVSSVLFGYFGINNGAGIMLLIRIGAGLTRLPGVIFYVLHKN